MVGSTALKREEVLTRLRRQAGGFLMEGFFRTLATAGQLHPGARPARHGVEVLRNIAYRPTGRTEHLLDIYRPSRQPGPWPVVLYIHGGAFRILSKDSHWLMGLAFARAGYLVANINYRLAPRNPFPAAVEDACAAAEWVHQHARSYGGDPGRLVVAGESAGANLATSVALACAYRRPEAYARGVFEAGIRPRAVIASCGMLQVSQPERFWARRRMPVWLSDRLQEVTELYLGGARLQYPQELDLADPLVALERAQPPERPLPPFYAIVGTRDPLLDDTRRLKAALDRMAVPCEAIYYPGEIHAFHALVWRSVARRSWRDTLHFLAPLMALQSEAAEALALAAE